jgi:hypothetical protein
MSRWYRAYSGTVRDDKLAECAVIAGCSRSVVIATWHAILESAADTLDGGRFETSARRVAAILGEALGTIEAVFAGMAEVGLIEGSTIPAWKARQFESDSSTDRVRKHREMKRNGGVTLQERCVTPPYTETDTDTERSGVAIAPAPSERALAMKAIEDPCLAIVSGTDWPVRTAQDWYNLTSLAVDDGLDVETEILPAIRHQVERAKAAGKRISTWGYFANGCREFARQARSPPQPMSPVTPRNFNTPGAQNAKQPTPMRAALDRLAATARGDFSPDPSNARTIDGDYTIAGSA